MTDPHAPNYKYRARVKRWVDADTVELEIDLGFFVHVHHRCRLLGIDTPERGQPGFEEANRAVEKLVPHEMFVHIHSQLPVSKYGQPLVTIYPIGAGENTPSVQQMLIENGFGKPYDGGTKS